jgi:hypothetical protein
MTRAAQPEGDAPAGTKSTMGKSRDAAQDAVSDAILEPIEEKLNHRVSCERKGAAGLSPAAPVMPRSEGYSLTSSPLAADFAAASASAKARMPS